MISHYILLGLIDGAGPVGGTLPASTPRADGGPSIQPRRQINVHIIEETERRIETIERVAKVARRRKPTPAQVEAVSDAVEWFTEARVAPIAVSRIEDAVDALNAATTRRMAFAKALERQVEAIRVEQARRKRNEEAAFVLILSI